VVPLKLEKVTPSLGNHALVILKTSRLCCFVLACNKDISVWGRCGYHLLSLEDHIVIQSLSITVSLLDNRMRFNA
jgi:hypothetical protein